MCYECANEIGIKIGWYEVPEHVRNEIIALEPNLRPLTYVLLIPGMKPDDLGFRREEKLRDFYAYEFGWFNTRSHAVQRCAGTGIGNYVVISGNAHWIMRPYVRLYRNFVEAVRKYQAAIRENSEVGQGYCYITFMGSNWEWGEVTIRLEMSGAPEFNFMFHSRTELLESLEHMLEIAKSRGYEPYD